MGQYYKPISIEKKQFVIAHDYDNGLKLMEHSWIGNGFVGVVENLIAPGGPWHGDHILWAGDYADPEPRQERNAYELISQSDRNKIKPAAQKSNYRYVVNLDTKQFVDKTKVPLSDVWVGDDGKEHPYAIHPLPLLTCEGNGRGGGDFRKQDPLVGSWARHRVTVSNEIPEGFNELYFDLFEGTIPAKLSKKQKV
jgi:hypothetical protein